MDIFSAVKKQQKGALWVSMLLFLFVLPLRLINLGYSDFICDETVALEFLNDHKEFYSFDFLIRQHKGPGQYVVGGLIFLLSHDLHNEFIYRLPSAIINALAVSVFYLFCVSATKSRLVSLFAAVTLGINGFMVSFGRIFQYQSFNIFFSSLSILCFSKIASNGVFTRVFKYFLLGSLFFSLSLLFHWDTVFIVPYVAYVSIKEVLFAKKLTAKQKTYTILGGLTIAMIVLVPFMFPFVDNYIHSLSQKNYFRTRINPISLSIESIKLQFETILYKIRLYNPLLFVCYVVFTLAFAFISFRKSRFFIFWTAVIFLVFLFLFTNTGTHIYNILIPLSVVMGMGAEEAFQLMVRNTRIHKTILSLVFSILSIGVIGFLYYQSYRLFVDYKPEYPTRDKVVLGFKVRGINEGDRKYYRNYFYNNKIGFPFRRDWEQIGKVLDEYEITNGIPIRSIPIQTNEITCTVKYYTGRSVEGSGKRFVVGIKYPMSLVNDYQNFSNPDKKDLISTIKNTDGDTLAKIYITRTP